MTDAAADPVETFAALQGVGVAALRQFLDGQWGPGDPAAAAQRLECFRKSCVLPAAAARKASKRKRADIPGLVDELVAGGQVKTKKQAFERLAERACVDVRTISNAYYALRPKSR